MLAEMLYSLVPFDLRPAVVPDDHAPSRSLGGAGNVPCDAPAFPALQGDVRPRRWWKVVRGSRDLSRTGRAAQR